MIYSKYLEMTLKILLLISIVNLSSCGSGQSSSGSNSSSSETGSGNGKAGSMARFSLAGDYLYTISGSNIQIFNIANDSIAPFATFPVAWDIETLFSTNTHLFIGAANGVYIYDKSNPANPTKVSQFLHVQSCDPVVVSGRYAYVTLRDGFGRCGRRGQNRLDVLDLIDIYNPVLVKSYNMQQPKGLGIQNGLLFVCDGAAGLKVFDLTDPANPKFSFTDTAVDCFDLIAYQRPAIKKNIVRQQFEPSNQDTLPPKIENNLLVSDNSGILQFNYDLLGLSQLSQIKNNPPLKN